MKIVGVGCGPRLLTEQAIEAISEAKSVYGSKRAIAIAQPYIDQHCPVTIIRDFNALDNLPEDAVVLSTGDPMLAGLGYLKGEIIPGISSLQVASARLQIPLDRIVPVIAHGSGHEQGIQQVLEELARNRIVFFIADPKFDCSELYRCIRTIGRPVTVAVCENIGYPEERITKGSGDDFPLPASPLYSLMIGVF
jgi:cobalt-precorrin-7 (C5)-methyltransferase